MPEWLNFPLALIFSTGGLAFAGTLITLFVRRRSVPLEQTGLVMSNALTEAQAAHELEKAGTLRDARWERLITAQDVKLEQMERRGNDIAARSEGLVERVEDLEADLDVAQRDKGRLRRGLRVTINYVEVLVPLADPLPPYPEGWDAIHELVKP